MKTKPRIRDTVKRLDAALAMVRQDRWQLAGLRSGRLVILAEGPGDGRPIEPPEPPPEPRVPEPHASCAASSLRAARRVHLDHPHRARGGSRGLGAGLADNP